jgi:hypothetical protein
MAYRTKYIDLDNRKRQEPETKYFCVRCGKELKPGQPYREVHCVDGGMFALHPDDESVFPKNDPGDMGCWSLGMDCARKLGLEWSRPGRTVTWCERCRHWIKTDEFIAKHRDGGCAQ